MNEMRPPHRYLENPGEYVPGATSADEPAQSTAGLAPAATEIPDSIELPLWALEVTGYGDQKDEIITNQYGSKALGRDWPTLCYSIEENGGDGEPQRVSHSDHALAAVREAKTFADREGLKSPEAQLSIHGLKNFFARYFEKSESNG